MPWHAYILECADGTLYAGSTNDLERRVSEHNESPKGAKYTRVRRPVSLCYSVACASRSEAAKQEAVFKSLTRAEKLLLISGSDKFLTPDKHECVRSSHHLPSHKHSVDGLG